MTRFSMLSGRFVRLTPCTALLLGLLALPTSPPAVRQPTGQVVLAARATGTVRSTALSGVAPAFAQMVRPSAAESSAAWSQQAVLTATGSTSSDGFALASAVSGDVVVIGAPGVNNAAGAAYVYARSGSTWSLQATLTAPDGARNDAFGTSVAVSGTTVAVGAPFKNAITGAVYVFVRRGTTWSQQAELSAADATQESKFGAAVALSGDTAVVGAIYHNSFRGAAYVFVRSGGAWTQQAEFTDPLPQGRFDFFGDSVAVNGDTALVGTSQRNGDTGEVFVYARRGTTWSQQADLADPLPRMAGDGFGGSVALGTDTAVIGAVGANGAKGVAYVYARSGSTWSRQARLSAGDGAANDAFAAAVTLSGDTAVVGAPLRNSTGAAYVFARRGTAWSQQAELTAAVAPGAELGQSVGLSGATAVAGAPGRQPSGAEYVFVRG